METTYQSIGTTLRLPSSDLVPDISWGKVKTAGQCAGKLFIYTPCVRKLVNAAYLQQKGMISEC